MKTEFNVERVCERVQLCVVDAPDSLGQPQIEVRGGSIYVSFAPVVFDPIKATTDAIEIAKPKRTSAVDEPAVQVPSVSTDEIRSALDADIPQGAFITKPRRKGR